MLNLWEDTDALKYAVGLSQRFAKFLVKTQFTKILQKHQLSKRSLNVTRDEFGRTAERMWPCMNVVWSNRSQMHLKWVHTYSLLRAVQLRLNHSTWIVIGSQVCTGTDRTGTDRIRIEPDDDDMWQDGLQ